MYIESWDSFYQQAEELYRRNPLRTRYVTKLRQCDGKLVLKVTDDNVVRHAWWPRSLPLSPTQVPVCPRLLGSCAVQTGVLLLGLLMC